MVNTSPPRTSSTSGSLQDTATQKTDTAKQAVEADVRDLKAQAKDDLSSLTETAKKDFDEARRAAGHYAEDQKNNAAGQLGEVASAVRRVADDLEQGDNRFVGRYAREIGDGLERFSSSAKSRSIEEIIGDVQNFGRRNPAAFMAGAALLGFAASRFVAASSERGASGSRNQGRNQGYEPDRYASSAMSRNGADGSAATRTSASAAGTSGSSVKTPSSSALNAGKEDI